MPNPLEETPTSIHQLEFIQPTHCATFRFAVAGDSAGGNLAAVAALRARDDGFQPPLKAQILNYPVTNHSFDNPSHQLYDKYLISVDKMKWYWDQYLHSPEEGLHPYASPLLAKDLSNLPPALVQLAELDILRDEGRLYAEALQKAGNDVQLSVKKGLIHGFIGMSMLAPTEVDEAYQEIVTFLKRTLN
jgi:acetyl esterase